MTTAPHMLILDNARCWFRGDIRITDASDTSREIMHYKEGRNTSDYSSECAACFLGHGHSKAYHDRNLVPAI